ncbi:YHS domain-containing protein [Raineyella sp. LH-20]|uniref:YHS domain-containing protein n=1 Tax=Raineyella sp. LH-20 TaxID=3081204 RepID=UPI002953DFBC|nr:YHS domain-containing protein [Raineyella sp. LH-20]WOP19888.1 YHS domain-containing protein [Raineyella sp. LH-20]
MTTTAVDPVCGMDVEVSPSTPTAEVDARTYYFCAPGCRKAFVKDPASFLGEKAGSGHGCGHCGDHHHDHH